MFVTRSLVGLTPERLRMYLSERHLFITPNVVNNTVTPGDIQRCELTFRKALYALNQTLAASRDGVFVIVAMGHSRDAAYQRASALCTVATRVRYVCDTAGQHPDGGDTGVAAGWMPLSIAREKLREPNARFRVHTGELVGGPEVLPAFFAPIAAPRVRALVIIPGAQRETQMWTRSFTLAGELVPEVNAA